jgi:signal transduction histidine kinase
MKSRRLLVVEGDGDRAQALHTLFEKHGAFTTLQIVGTTEKCIKALTDDFFSALLVDSEADGFDVLGFVRKLRIDGLRIPIFVLVSSTGNEKIEQLRAIEDDYVVKIERNELDTLPRLVCLAIEKHELKSQLAAFERRLIQNEKLAMIGLLTGGIAHDLRNPLNTIDAMRYYLAGLSSLQDPKLQEKLEVIHKNVQRASGIMTNLLEFSRPSKHRRQAIDIGGVLDSTLKLFGKELSVKKIEVIKRYEKIPLVIWNLDAVKQVFLNLVMNAVQAMPAGGALTISMRRADKKKIEISIADTGVGISPENRQRLFSPFFSTKAEKEGTGLGLYISNLIVEREGGKITVESEMEKGSVFSVLLPIGGISH